MMKFRIITLLMICVVFHAQSQGKVQYLQNFDKKPFHWGYYVGFNQTSLDEKVDGQYAPEGSTNSSYGFNVGLVGDYRLTDHLNLRFEPGLFSTGKKGIKPEGVDEFIEWNSTYLRLPILLKVSTDRLKNLRPFLKGGVSFNYNFKNTPDDLSGLGYKIRKSQFVAELGVGIDFYLHYFKCSPAIKGIYGITDELDKKSGAPPFDSIQTKGILFSITFE